MRFEGMNKFRTIRSLGPGHQLHMAESPTESGTLPSNGVTRHSPMRGRTIFYIRPDPIFARLSPPTFTQ